MKCLALVGIGAVVASTAASRAEVVTSSSFEASSEGWAVFSTGMGGMTYAVDWEAKGGNPGGHIAETDPDDGGWFFTAGPAYLGDQSGLYPGQIVYDFFHTVPNGEGVDAPEDIALRGAGMTLAIDTEGWPPLDEWVTLRFPIDARAEWFVMETGERATESQLRAVLADLEEMLVRGEFFTGADTGRVDNVRLRTCLPDLDDNGVVDVADLVALLAGWGSAETDVTGDFTTDTADLIELLARWGGC